MTHNYRDRLGGFIDWVEKMVSSKTVANYRKKVSDSETGFGPTRRRRNNRHGGHQKQKYRGLYWSHGNRRPACYR
jgi:hypothetical protein